MDIADLLFKYFVIYPVIILLSIAGLISVILSISGIALKFLKSAKERLSSRR